MSRPLLTIGIPTFNRAEFLHESLQSATSQNYPNLQIVVCDNASTDNTQSVVRKFKDERIVYHRNDSNIGALANFSRTLELAQGEYFAWLQDDDLLFNNFPAIAISEMERTTDAVAFIAFAVLTNSTKSIDFMGSALFGPPVSLNWVDCTSRVMERYELLPWCLLQHFGFSPTAVFKSDILRSVVEDSVGILGNMYFERIVIARLSAAGRIIVSPAVQGILRSHTRSASHENVQKIRALGKNFTDPYWHELHDTVLQLWHDPCEVRDLFLKDMRQVGTLHRERLRSVLDPYMSEMPLASMVASWLDASFGSPVSTHDFNTPNRKMEPAMHLLKDLLPPLFWRIASRLTRRFRMPSIP